MSWSELVDADLERQTVEWRRHFHSHPEASFEEHETSSFIAQRLAEWGIEVERPLATGVVGRIRGSKSGPIVALRADIDALTMQEENEFEYASSFPGRMHACGHDGHTAILLAIARLISSLPEQPWGEVRLLFQPAEERLNGGAEGFLKAGVLEGVDLVLGMHLMSTLDSGLVSVREGSVMASTDEFHITVRGRGGHAAFPHQAVDALVVAAQLVCELQTIVSRRVDPLEAAVLTVGTFHAGTAFNIIPGEATLSGTVRTLSEAVRATMKEELERIVSRGASALGAEATLNYLDGNPVVVNDPAATRLMADAATSVVGPNHVLSIPPMMGGDDFAFYAQRVPSAYIFVGTRNADAGSTYPHHHPRFTIDEASLGTGIRILLEGLERYARSRS